MRKQLSNMKQLARAVRALPVALALLGGLGCGLGVQAQTLGSAPAPAPVSVSTVAVASAPPAACPPVAQMPAPAVLQRMARSARDHGLLWRVDHRGHTAWLYGTLHVAQLPWAIPGPTVAAALRASDSLALELNMLDPAQMQVLQAGMRANPTAAPLPPALAQRLDAQVQAACLPADAMQALRPDAQALTLLTLAGRRQGLDPAYGIDMALAGAARALGKPVWALETPEQQLRALISDDPAEVQDRVRSTMEQLESGDAARGLGELAQAWADGRASLLETYPQWCHCMDSAKERADFARLVDGRNPAMARQVAAQLRAGKAPFVAVGSLHLVGAQGLPALLAAQGFAVRRVQWPESAEKTPAAQ